MPKKKIDLETIKYYLQDTIYILKEYAVEAELERRKNPQDEFKSGIACGMLSLISTMQNQAISFNIPLKELRLDDIDPEGDPLGEKKPKKSSRSKKLKGR